MLPGEKDIFCMLHLNGKIIENGGFNKVPFRLQQNFSSVATKVVSMAVTPCILQCLINDISTFPVENVCSLQQAVQLKEANGSFAKIKSLYLWITGVETPGRFWRYRQEREKKALRQWEETGEGYLGEKKKKKYYLQASEAKPDLLYLLRLQVFQRVALKFFDFLSGRLHGWRWGLGLRLGADGRCPHTHTRTRSPL